jgi:hypothetical protein
MALQFRVNLGGEGEESGVLNQQPRFATGPNWFASLTGHTLDQLVTAGHDVLISDNTAVALPDGCADEVITNGVPIDITTWLGPGVQSSEVRRILKAGGVWTDNGRPRYVKP